MNWLPRSMLAYDRETLLRLICTLTGARSITKKCMYVVTLEKITALYWIYPVHRAWGPLSMVIVLFVDFSLTDRRVSKELEMMFGTTSESDKTRRSVPNIRTGQSFNMRYWRSLDAIAVFILQRNRIGHNSLQIYFWASTPCPRSGCSIGRPAEAVENAKPTSYLVICFFNMDLTERDLVLIFSESSSFWSTKAGPFSGSH